MLKRFRLCFAESSKIYVRTRQFDRSSVVRHLLANVYTHNSNLLLEKWPVFCYTEGSTADDIDTLYWYEDSLARGYVENGKVLPLDSLRFIMHTMPEKQT